MTKEIRLNVLVVHCTREHHGRTRIGLAFCYPVYADERRAREDKKIGIGGKLKGDSGQQKAMQSQVLKLRFSAQVRLRAPVLQ